MNTLYMNRAFQECGNVFLRVDVVDSPSFIFPFYSVYASHKENIITLLESIKLLNILIEIDYA